MSKTLSKYIREKYIENNNKTACDWRIGNNQGMRNIKIDQTIINMIGKRELFEQADQLERSKIIEVEWMQVNLTYSQTLAWKGNLVYSIEGRTQDSSQMIYGELINAQTLVHSEPVSIEGIKNIITINTNLSPTCTTDEPLTIPYCIFRRLLLCFQTLV